MSGVVEMVRDIICLATALLIGAALIGAAPAGAGPISALFQTPFYCGVTSTGQ
jgi:hypothetical protein